MSALGAATPKLVKICFGVLKHQETYQSQVVNLSLVIDLERLYLHIYLCCWLEMIF